MVFRGTKGGSPDSPMVGENVGANCSGIKTVGVRVG